MARVHGSVDNLHGLLTAHAATTPDKSAILAADADGVVTDTTYRMLTDRIDDYCAVLDGLGLDVGDRVLVEAETSASAIAVLLACARLGLPFVPVSPKAPDNRIATIIESVEPSLHIRAGDARPGLPSVATATLDATELRVDSRPVRRTRRRREVLATDTAYVIFTSGTTGRPKGVVMSHRAIVAFLRAVVGDGIAAPDARIASASPLHFDFALFDIGISLSAGAALVPISAHLLSSPRRLIRMLRDTGVTQVDGVPSIWRPVLRHAPELLTGLTGLRRIVFAGEEFPLPELRRLQSVLPSVRVINGYGATESMACSFTDVPNPLPESAERLPIGTVHTGAEVTLVAADGSIVDEPGVPGEMHLHSPSLFTGYWNDPDATAAVLVPDPVDGRHGRVVLRTGDLAYRDENGQLYFCGRVDSQVQIRGNRVELGEVENTLARFPEVSAAVATTATTHTGDLVLVAYVVLEPATAELDERKALDFCAAELPAYMVPRQIHVIPELPLTANGKVDRTVLGCGTPDRTTRQEVPSRGTGVQR